MSESQSQTYEQNFQRLQQVVEMLENETLGLEQSLTLFEEGMKLSQLCDAQLSKVEERVKVLTSEPTEPLSTRAAIPLETVPEQAMERTNE